MAIDEMSYSPQKIDTMIQRNSIVLFLSLACLCASAKAGLIYSNDTGLVGPWRHILQNGVTQSDLDSRLFQGAVWIWPNQIFTTSNKWYFAPISKSDLGVEKSLKDNLPDFNAFVNYLTNGVDDTFLFGYNIPGDSSSLGGAPESIMFGALSGQPDLNQYHIDDVTFTFLNWEYIITNEQNPHFSEPHRKLTSGFMVT